MKKISRRKAIGSAASFLAAVGLARQARAESRPVEERAAPRHGAVPVRTMTLDEFLDLDESEVDRVLSHMDCENFSCCHEKVKTETGIWIPELVPVFEKLDALGAHPGS